MTGDQGAAFLGELGVTLFAALIGGIVSRSLHVPIIVGYLLAGIAVGPYTPGFIADEAMVGAVADLGVTLLMFMVGIHFSLRELLAVHRTAVYGGGAQIIATILLGTVVGRLLGWGWLEASNSAAPSRSRRPRS
jgi:CPA2 family monovalent cation:H+ antiporter-2